MSEYDIERVKQDYSTSQNLDLCYIEEIVLQLSKFRHNFRKIK